MPDQKSSGASFCQLFGWTRKEVDAGQFGAYTLFRKNGRDVGRICVVADPTGAVAHLMQPVKQ